jgi:hypothetical protein
MTLFSTFNYLYYLCPRIQKSKMKLSTFNFQLSTSSRLRFRRWSRKAYAAFCSIGRCVSIGRLGKNVVEASLKKRNPSTAACLQKPAEATDMDTGEEAETADVLLQLLSAAVICQPSAVGAAGCDAVLKEINRKIYRINRLDAARCIQPVFLFVSLKNRIV